MSIADFSDLEDAHCALIIAARAVCALIEDEHAIEAGALRAAERSVGEAISDLMQRARLIEQTKPSTP